MTIAFAPDEEQALLVDTVRRLGAEVLRPGARAWEREGGVPTPARRAFHALGLGLLDVPEDRGGAGQGQLTAALLHEELAFGDPGGAVAIFAPHLAAAAVCELGAAAQGQRLLARFAATDGAERLGAVAWAEPPGGPREGFGARAEADPAGGYRLIGDKILVINGGRAELTVVFAQVDAAAGWDGVGAFAVEGRPEGMQAGGRDALLGLGAVEVTPLSLRGVHVPEENRLRGGGRPFATGLRRLLCRQMLVAAARQVGLARAAYEQALGYTQDRHAFGKPVAHFQAVAFALADAHMDVEAARGLVLRAAAAFDHDGSDEREVLRLCAEASRQANEVGFSVADTGVQLLGGAGFIRDFPSEKWMRETRALAMMGPGDQVAEEVIGAALLDEAPLANQLFPSLAMQPMLA